MATKKKTSKQTEKKPTKSCGNSGIYIPAGIFLGLGIGMLIGEAGAGVIIGMGAGFLAMAISNSKK